MANFAVIDGTNVLNVIVADSKAIAEEVTNKTCVEILEEDEAEPNGFYINKKFIKAKPFPSWVLNKENVWEAPVPMPTDIKVYAWDENTVSWVEEVTPEE